MQESDKTSQQQGQEPSAVAVLSFLDEKALGTTWAVAWVAARSRTVAQAYTRIIMPCTPSAVVTEKPTQHFHMLVWLVAVSVTVWQLGPELQHWHYVQQKA